MRIGIRWRRLVTERICAILLLGVALVAIVIPVDLASSQPSARAAAQVPLFTAIDLTPNGFGNAGASGISEGQEVGDAEAPGTSYPHALLWRGTADSVVDLTPRTAAFAFATGVCGAQQVGYGQIPDTHALLWRGSADSVVDLNPPGFASKAVGTNGREQVGFGIPPAGGSHALLWHGSAESVVDLHPRGFTRSEATGISGDEQVGWAYLGGYSDVPSHALLWHGSAPSMVDLHPHGFTSSEADATSGEEQVGWGIPPGGAYPGGPFHALLWHGTAASVVDLHPRGYTSSQALGVSGGEQVGRGHTPTADVHALLWRGTAGSAVDLHTFLPPGFVHSGALGIDAAGDVVGWASSQPYSSHAILWKRSVPRPSPSQGHNTTGC